MVQVILQGTKVYLGGEICQGKANLWALVEIEVIPEGR